MRAKNSLLQRVASGAASIANSSATPEQLVAPPEEAAEPFMT